jgi:hypothetical protein
MKVINTAKDGRDQILEQIESMSVFKKAVVTK